MKAIRSLEGVRQAAPIYVLGVLIALTALMGGSSREDVVALLVLRPAAIVALGVAVALLNREQLAQYRSVIWSAAAIAGLVAIQSIPLPPFIWQALPGRDVIREAAALSGNAQTWHPFAMVPWRAANALFALTVPFAALLLAIVSDTKQRRIAMAAFALVSLASAALAFLQALAPHVSALRVYDPTDTGVATGLLANRNHQAALLACAIPMVAALVAHYGQRRSSAAIWQSIGGIAILLLATMTVLTGSRAGLLMLATGLAALPVILPADWLRHLRPTGVRGWIVCAVIAALLAGLIVGALLFANRIDAVERLALTQTGEELRFQMFGPILEMAWQYAPFGSGTGSFVEVYQIGEPAALLGPNYVNHAHNDWLELLLEGGAIAAAMLLLGAIRFARGTWVALRLPQRESIQARAGSAVVLILAVGSVLDYPVRAPLLAALFRRRMRMDVDKG